jgi:hypothetical protein
VRESRLLSTLIPPVLALFLVACATPPDRATDESCTSDTVLLDAHFEGANLGECTVTADGGFELEIFPEDEPPINPSPWYGFRISGRAGDEASIRMTFPDAYARYWPKISRDGNNWQALDESRVSIDEEREWMELNIELEQAQLWIAGQELLTRQYYDEWLHELEVHADINTRLLGQSVQNRPIYLAETDDRPELVLLFGRQHPPEVSGAIAMRSFVRTVLEESDLARQFRDRFKLAIIPLLNPDGVALGHWRHNVNGVDVNRDWGPFTQPETRAVMAWLEGVEATGTQLRLLLDFHSTLEDLFYTQPVEENPPDFASLWLGAAAQRLPDFPFKQSADPVNEQANAKNYFYVSRGIPAITYESGDETDREQLKHSAKVFAEEMMRLMLASPESR